MTLDQGLAFAILLAMVGLFVWDRLRYDVVALLALLAAIAAGVVPADKAFSGFGDPILIIIGSALVLSRAISQSGLVEAVIRPLAPRMRTTTVQVAVLVGAVTALSALMKNVGALAIFLPVAFQIARRTETPVSRLLMPMAFGSLLGGLITLIGTSPNIIVSRVRTELLGEPFTMFDFTPVGLGIAAAGVAFLTVGWRLLPTDRRGHVSAEDLFRIEDYTSEAQVPETSPMVGKTVADLEALAEYEVTVTAIIREKFRRYVPAKNWMLFAGDILVLECDPHALKRIVDRAGLELVGTKELAVDPTRSEEIGVVEAVVTADSPMVGCSPTQLRLRDRYGVNLLAVGSRGTRATKRLRLIKFKPGDVLVLQGSVDTMPETLGQLGCLPLAQRNLQLGRPRKVFLPAVILAVAMGTAALEVVPVAVAFFAAAVLLVVLDVVAVKDAYDSIEWPILILLGALIPVSDAVRTTGGTELLADWLAVGTGALPPIGAVGLMMIAAMAVTPFLNNAATVLLVAPIGASLAGKLGLSPDPFLMAVAIGAACDFLTPIGHQCNTLVMGPGGYRFGDYWRLGLPLSTLVVLVGLPLIVTFWPLS